MYSYDCLKYESSENKNKFAGFRFCLLLVNRLLQQCQTTTHAILQ